MWKNVHPIDSAEIQTHNLQNMNQILKYGPTSASFRLSLSFSQRNDKNSSKFDFKLENIDGALGIRTGYPTWAPNSVTRCWI